MPTWKEITAANPLHSRNYAARWRQFAAEGKDIVGEARLIDAMAQRSSRILDAGCGTGRIGGYLHNAGHHVTGVDVDPYLIDVARQDFPEATWEVGDLAAEGSIPTSGMGDGTFDLIVCAGNVVGFLAPEEREPALRNLYQALAKPTQESLSGRCLIGFGAGRGLLFPQFLEIAQEVGFHVDSLHSTWDLRPFDPQTSNFLVAIFSA